MFKSVGTDPKTVYDSCDVFRDIFRNVSIPVLTVCRVARPELVVGLNYIKFVGSSNDGVSASSFICEADLILKYSTMNFEALVASLFTLVFLLLYEPICNSSSPSLILISQTIQRIVDHEPENKTIPILTDLALFLLGVRHLLSSMAIEIFLQWYLPIIIRNVLIVDEDEEVSIIDPNLEGLSFVILNLIRSVIPGNYSKPNLQILETICSLFISSEAVIYHPMLIFIRKFPNLCAILAIQAARWVLSFSPDNNERPLNLLMSILDDPGVARYSFKLGGTDLAHLLAMIPDFKIKIQPVTAANPRQAAPSILRLCFPSHAGRWLEYLFLYTEEENSRFLRVDQRSLASLISDAPSSDHGSLALQALAGYIPKHMEWLLSHRLSQKVDVICPMALAYVNILSLFALNDFRNTAATKPSAVETLTFMQRISTPKLLSYLSFFDLKVSARFANMYFWLISICGAGFRFPVSQVVHNCNIEDLNRLPSSFIVTLAASSSSMANTRLSFLSPVIYFYTANDEKASSPSYLNTKFNDQITLDLMVNDILATVIPPPLIDRVVIAVLISIANRSHMADSHMADSHMADSHMADPHMADSQMADPFADPVISNLVTNLDNIYAPLAILNEYSRQPSEVNRFVDVLCIFGFLVAQTYSSARICRSIILALLAGSLRQAVESNLDALGVSLTGNVIENLEYISEIVKEIQLDESPNLLNILNSIFEVKTSSLSKTVSKLKKILTDTIENWIPLQTRISRLYSETQTAALGEKENKQLLAAQQDEAPPPSEGNELIKSELPPITVSDQLTVKNNRQIARLIHSLESRFYQAKKCGILFDESEILNLQLDSVYEEIWNLTKNKDYYEGHNVTSAWEYCEIDPWRCDIIIELIRSQCNSDSTSLSRILHLIPQRFIPFLLLRILEVYWDGPNHKLMVAIFVRLFFIHPNIQVDLVNNLISNVANMHNGCISFYCLKPVPPRWAKRTSQSVNMELNRDELLACIILGLVFLSGIRNLGETCCENYQNIADLMEEMLGKRPEMRFPEPENELPVDEWIFQLVKIIPETSSVGRQIVVLYNEIIVKENL